VFLTSCYNVRVDNSISWNAAETWSLLSMKNSIALVAAASAVMVSGAAHAGVHWSVGINLAPPVVYAPVYAPAPVYYAPPVVYRAPVAVYEPAQQAPQVGGHLHARGAQLVFCRPSRCRPDAQIQNLDAAPVRADRADAGTRAQGAFDPGLQLTNRQPRPDEDQNGQADDNGSGDAQATVGAGHGSGGGTLAS
jgi:hypothetical protein